MARRPITEILIEINDLLKKDKQMSINSIAKKLKSQWRTADKALEVLKKLGIVKEIKGTSSLRDERIFFRT